jgi:uncharacterized protein (DUF433 family)
VRLEAEGARLLPIAARRAIAKKIESAPGIDAVVLTEGSALVIQVKSVRLELDQELKKLERAANIVISDPEIMRGTPAYRGTPIPVELIADMLTKGARPDEILEGYPALDREKIDLAPLYVQAFRLSFSPPWASCFSPVGEAKTDSCNSTRPWLFGGTVKLLIDAACTLL